MISAVGVRNGMVESEDHRCPICNEPDQSPAQLIANKFLRTAVRNYENETDYRKVTTKLTETITAPAAPPPQLPVVEATQVPDSLIGKHMTKGF